MATFSTNVVTPAQTAATALITAIAAINTLRLNFAAGLPGTTLAGLAGSGAPALRAAMGSLRTQLDVCAADLGLANSEVQAINSAIGALGAMD